MGSSLVKMGLLYLNSQDFFDNAAASMGVDDANSCHEIYVESKRKEKSIMFIENYRLDTMVGGQAQTTLIPYPKISHEDWLKWKAFLPVKSVPFCKKVLLGARETFLQAADGI